MCSAELEELIGTHGECLLYFGIDEYYCTILNEKFTSYNTILINNNTLLSKVNCSYGKYLLSAS
jgi:hypothetical protein